MGLSPKPHAPRGPAGQATRGTAALDTACPIETPEGVDIEVSPAGPVVRFAAWLLDTMVRWVGLAFAATALGVLGAFGGGIFLLLVFAAEWLYPVLFEVLWDGQTPGKKVLGLRVIREDGTPVGWGESVLRNLLRVADFLPFLYALGLASMLLSSRFRRLGDLAAGTLVVAVDRGGALAGGLPNAKPMPPAMPLDLAEQRAVIHFAQRAPVLGEARSMELAKTVEVLMAPVPGASQYPIHYLCSLAAWLAGRRPGGTGAGGRSR